MTSHRQQGKSSYLFFLFLQYCLYNFAPLGNFSCFLLSVDFINLPHKLLKKKNHKHYPVPNRLDPDKT